MVYQYLSAPMLPPESTTFVNITNITNSTPFQENDARWCYLLHRPEACVRISLLLILAIITGILCTLRIIQYHCYKAKNYHQYVIYYMALLICLLSIIHWAYVRTAVFDFINTYLIVLQLLVISHFFFSWASRILQQEKAFNWIVIPILIVVLVYFTAVVLWACLSIEPVKKECTRPQWLLFTSSQLVIVQLFLIAVIYITRKLNCVRTSRINRLSQKAQLWGLTTVYEIVSITTFVYDLYLLITQYEDSDCGKIITSNSVGGTIIYIVHKVFKYFLSQWAICIIFSPLKRTPVESGTEDTLSWAEKPLSAQKVIKIVQMARGNYQSTFYQTSGEDEEEEAKETLGSYPINATFTRRNYPILPRSTPLSPNSYQSSPWLKTAPGQSFPSPSMRAMQS